MTTYTLPAGVVPASMVWGLQRKAVRSTSDFTGSSQTVDLLAWLWSVEIRINNSNRNGVANELEALFNLLTGGVDKLQLHRLDKPAPRGTLRGTPTLIGSHAQFAATLSVQTTAGATLLAGDFMGMAGQLLQVAANCTANGSGVLSVPLVNRIRASAAGGTALVWDRPSVLFKAEDTASAFELLPGKRMGAFAFKFMEAL